MYLTRHKLARHWLPVRNSPQIKRQLHRRHPPRRPRQIKYCRRKRITKQCESQRVHLATVAKCAPAAHQRLAAWGTHCKTRVHGMQTDVHIFHQPWLSSRRFPALGRLIKRRQVRWLVGRQLPRICGQAVGARAECAQNDSFALAHCGRCRCKTLSRLQQAGLDHYLGVINGRQIMTRNRHRQFALRCMTKSR